LSKEDDENEKVYQQAMKRVDELVEEVYQTISYVAEENHYGKDWVLERFRERFNKSKRSFLES
jgi:hypothetical protein